MSLTTAPVRARLRSRALLGAVVALALAVTAQVTLTDTTAAQTPSQPGASAPARSTAAVSALVAGSFLGGSEWDEGSDVEVDAAGNSYVAGFTLSPDFPVRGAAQPRFRGSADGFVTKVAADGSRVLWSTYLGGVDLDVPHSLALDGAGNVYVTGRTASPDFPTTRGAFQRRLRGTLCQRQVPCHDAFVTKLSPQGRLVYSTLLGGSANEEGVGIAVDSRGRAWVTGNTDSTDLPLQRPLQRAFQSPPCPGDLPCEYDVFVAALAADGSRLHFSTYLGGDASDTAGGIAVDRSDHALVTGTTRSADFPVTGRALQRRIAGRQCGPPPGAPCLDAFVSRIADRRLVSSTYLGGTQDERASGIAVDASGQSVVTGSTRSPGLPLRGAVQGALDNASCTTSLPEERCDDAFVARLSRTGDALLHSTYFGGAAEDQGLAVTVDTAGNALVAGRTDSRDLLAQRAAQPSFGGYIDGFATAFARGTGAVLWSTFAGGSKADRVTGIDTHRSGRVHLTGRTLSPDLRTLRPFQPAMAKSDDYDAFLHVLG